jgi:transposase
MSKGKHSETEMIGALKQLEAGRKAGDVGREVGVSKHTIYAWKAKYGGMDVSQAQEAKQDAIVEERGQPLAIRCDNGPELTSRHFLA